MAGLYFLLNSPCDASLHGFALGLVSESLDICSFLLALAAFLGFWAALASSGREFNPKTQISRRRQDAARTLWTVAAAGIALFLLRVLLKSKTTILPWPGGERFFWLDDDMMISMRYARNLAAGNGLVWNAGEPPVEGFSNFLWTLFMALPHAVGLPDRLASAPIILANVGLLIATLFLASRLLRAWAVPAPLASLGVLILASNKWLLHWTASGGEGVLLGVLALAAALDLTRATRAKPAGARLGLVFGLMALTRVDAPALILGFAPLTLFLISRRRARWSALAMPALCLAGLTLFRRSYYGEWLPNTFYLKSVDMPLKAPMGAHYSLYLFLFYGSICLLSLGALAGGRSIRTRLMVFAPWAQIALAALAGGDELPQMRFYVPALPLLVACAMVGAERLLARPRRSAPRNPFGLAPGSGFGWVALGIGLTVFRSLATPEAARELGADRGLLEKNNVRIGLILKMNTLADARIAHYWAGAAPYFSDRPAIDLLGKSDPYIARLKGHPGEWPPGHNKYDLAHSLGLRPDVIVSAHPTAILDEKTRAADPGREVYPGLFRLYDEPLFQSQYREGAAPLEICREFHGVFVRAGSTQAAPPADWVNEYGARESARP